VSARSAARLLALGVAAVGLLYFYRLWACPGVVYSDHSDAIVEHLGHRALLQRAVAQEGRLPLWNPSMNCGYPEFANPLTMPVFPFELLFLALPLDRAANLVFLLNFLTAGLTMFLYTLDRLERPVSAFVCGLGYMLSYRYLALLDAGWLPRMSLIALAPLLFWALDRLVRFPTFRNLVFFAGSLALGLLQSDLQQLYYASLACIPYTALRLIRLGRSERLAAAGRLLVAAAAGLLLAAPLLLPRLEFLALSTRAESSYEFFRYRPPTLSSLWMFLDPLDEGGRRVEYWENVLYFGLWLYPLGLYALLRSQRRRLCRLLALGSLVPLLLAFDTPLLRLLYHGLPGFGIFRIPGRMLFLSQLFGTVLAGLGIDALLLGTPRRWHGPLLLLLAGLPVEDAAVRMLPRLRTVPLAEAFPMPPFHAELRRDATDGRVAAIGRGALFYGMAGLYGIDLVNGYSSLNLKHYLDYFLLMKHGDPRLFPRGPQVFTDLSQIARPDLLAALDGRFLLATESYPLEDFGYEKLASYQDVPVVQQYRGLVPTPVHVWRLREPLGPAFFATSVHRVDGEEASLAAVARAPSVRQAFVLGYDGKPGWFDHPGTARSTRRGIDEYDYETESSEDGFLILSQVWYPGWTAELDGKPLRLYRTSHALLGCAVPAGRHRLHLQMTCPRLWQGLGLAAFGMAGLFLLGLIDRRAKRRATRTDVSGASGHAPAC
jgi:hypothetical protein